MQRRHKLIGDEALGLIQKSEGRCVRINIAFRFRATIRGTLRTTEKNADAVPLARRVWVVTSQSAHVHFSATDVEFVFGALPDGSQCEITLRTVDAVEVIPQGVAKAAPAMDSTSRG